MPPGPRRAVALVALACALATLSPSVASAVPGRNAAGRASPPSRAARELQMKAVVRAWSARLNARDNAGVARLFAVPAVIVQGSYVYRLNTRAQVALWHSGLPCAGRIVSIAARGAYATAVFRLADRGSTHCDAPGTLAAARFEFVKGKIAVWMQVPVPEKQAGGGLVA